MSDLPRIDIDPLQQILRGPRWLCWYLIYLAADRDHAMAVRSADVRIRARLPRH